MKTDMKKILIPVLSLLMAAFAVSCTPQEPDYSGMKAVLGIEVADMLDLYEVNKRQQKTVNLKVAAEAVPGTTLNITLGVNPELVAAYNEANGKNYEMLPAEAYSFVDRELMLPRFNKISSLGQINLIGRGCESQKTYLLPVVIEKVDGSDNFELSETSVAYFVFKMNVPVGGDGSPEDPYLIKDVNDFLTMNDKLLSGETSYFEMTADIDMSGVTDFPLLNPKPYTAGIVFNGKGHKIRNYACANALFHVLNGSFENVVFENAAVGTGAAETAIISKYLGYVDSGKPVPGIVKNIVFRDCKLSGGNLSGMVAGYAYNATVENVYAENCEVTLTGRRHAAFIGRVVADTELKNCYMKGGKITGGTQQVGGLVGENLQTNLKMTYCGISAELTGNRAIGPILSYSNGTPAEGTTEPLGSSVIENCIVWTPSILSSATQAQYSSGAVVGCAYLHPVTYKNNLRRADFEFVDFKDAPDQNPLRDMADILGTACPGGPVSNAYNYAYHGKAAAAGVTASQAAKQLGWDEAIWDLSGAEPRLK